MTESPKRIMVLCSVGATLLDALSIAIDGQQPHVGSVVNAWTAYQQHRRECRECHTILPMLDNDEDE